MKLDDWQREDVHQLINRERSLLVEPIGSGKTVIVGGFLHVLFKSAQVERGVVVCGGSLCEQWKESLHAQLGWAPVITDGKKLNKWETLYITSYQAFRARADKFAQYQPQVFIIDEVTVIKNIDSKLSQVARQVSQPCRWVVGATDSIVEKSPRDVLSALTFVNLSLSYEAMLPVYVGMRYDAKWDRYREFPQEIEQLKRIVVKEVVSGMTGFELYPNIKLELLGLDMPPDMAGVYQAKSDELYAIQDYSHHVTNNRAYGVLSRSCTGGRDGPKLTWICADGRIDQPTIYVCAWKKSIKVVADALKEKGRRVLVWTGDTTPARRERHLPALRSGRYDDLVMTFVGSHGLNLQCFGRMVFVEVQPNVERVRETIGRIFRRNSPHSVIEVVWLYTKNTIEESVSGKLRRELSLLSSILGRKLDPLGMESDKVINAEQNVQPD